MTNNEFLPKSKNLSVAWAEAFLALMKRGTEKLTPAIITIKDIADGEPRENLQIRARLDEELERLEYQSCHTIANTIFPKSLWNSSSEENAHHLFTRYDKIWPRIKRDRRNTRGTYFRRLMAYSPKNTDGEPINQLQHIIETFKKGNHRSSALQAGIFDPTRDHSHNRRLGFPCLQQVGFILDGDELTVTGYYHLQYSFERSYGNYLGLCRLGQFVARNLKLSLVQATCTAAVLKRSDPSVSKTCLQDLAGDLRQIVNNAKREIS